jgi:hypothetical protein
MISIYVCAALVHLAPSIAWTNIRNSQLVVDGDAGRSRAMHRWKCPLATRMVPPALPNVALLSKSKITSS